MPVDRPTDPDGLTIKQRAFVHAYVGKAQGNGIQACKLAGYKGSDKTLKALAHKQINHPLICKAIRAHADAASDDAVATSKEVLQRLTSILRDKDADPKDVIASGQVILKVNGAFITKHEVDVKAAAVKFVFEDNGRGPALKG